MKAKACTAPIPISAAQFVKIARPGDVFEMRRQRFTVETVSAEPLVIRARRAAERVMLTPAASEEIQMLEVAP